MSDIEVFFFSKKHYFPENLLCKFDQISIKFKTSESFNGFQIAEIRNKKINLFHV